MKRILAYLKPQARMTLQLTIKFAGTMLELLLPSMLSTILDDIAPRARHAAGVFVGRTDDSLFCSGACLQRRGEQDVDKDICALHKAPSP